MRHDSNPASRGALTAALLLAAAVLPGMAAAKDIDGAVTLVTSTAPDYIGGRDYGTSVRPGFLLNWGRLTLSSGGAFAATRQDKVSRGLGFIVTRTDDLQVSLGLRFDGGRSESDSPALAGLGDIKATVRARIAASWRWNKEWRLDGSWTADTFNRGGGDFGEVTLEREEWIAPHTQLGFGGTLTLAGRRYLQTYFGITPEQSARTAYAVYTPVAGLRDVAAFLSLKTDLGADWVVLGAVSASRLIGPAADSPLVQRATSWGVTAGLGYRF